MSVVNTPPSQDVAGPDPVSNEDRCRSDYERFEAAEDGDELGFWSFMSPGAAWA